jgi:hypothetical protein
MTCESLVCSQEQEVDCWVRICLDGNLSATSNGTATASGSLPSASQTASCPPPPSSAMSEHSSVKGTPQHIRDWLMSLAEDSPANHSVSPVSARERETSAICGLPPSGASAWYDQDTASWRTYQDSLLAGISGESWATWPRAGMTQDGVFYPRLRWERRISAIGSGLLPTPTGQMARPDMNRQNRPNSGADDLGSLVKKLDGGMLNPRWVEWLMDMPEGWLSCAPLAMHKWQQWQQQHGGC